MRCLEDLADKQIPNSPQPPSKLPTTAPCSVMQPWRHGAKSDSKARNRWIADEGLVSGWDGARSSLLLVQALSNTPAHLLQAADCPDMLSVLWRMLALPSTWWHSKLTMRVVHSHQRLRWMPTEWPFPRYVDVAQTSMQLPRLVNAGMCPPSIWSVPACIPKKCHAHPVEPCHSYFRRQVGPITTLSLYQAPAC